MDTRFLSDIQFVAALLFTVHYSLITDRSLHEPTPDTAANSIKKWYCHWSGCYFPAMVRWNLSSSLQVVGLPFQDELYITESWSKMWGCRQTLPSTGHMHLRSWIYGSRRLFSKYPQQMWHSWRYYQRIRHHRSYIGINLHYNNCATPFEKIDRCQDFQALSRGSQNILRFCVPDRKSVV